MKLIVTGGAGFLGYHVSNQLAHKVESIISLDIEPVNPKDYPDSVPGRCFLDIGAMAR